eukprot:4091412-Amphidinium_carterae.1
MCEKGWGTMANYAFSSPYVPGTQDESAFTRSAHRTSPGTQDESAFAKNVLIPLLGSVDHADAAKLRRLVYEAYTTAALDSQARQTRCTEDVPRKLPLQEKTARQKQLASRLLGLRLDDEMEPAHLLID